MQDGPFAPGGELCVYKPGSFSFHRTPAYYQLMSLIGRLWPGRTLSLTSNELSIVTPLPTFQDTSSAVCEAYLSTQVNTALTRCLFLPQWLYLSLSSLPFLTLCLSVCLCVSVRPCLCNCLSLFLCLSTRLPFFVSACLCLCLSVCLYVCLSIQSHAC